MRMRKRTRTATTITLVVLEQKWRPSVCVFRGLPAELYSTLNIQLSFLEWVKWFKRTDKNLEKVSRLSFQWTRLALLMSSDRRHKVTLAILRYFTHHGMVCHVVVTKYGFILLPVFKTNYIYSPYVFIFILFHLSLMGASVPFHRRRWYFGKFIHFHI